MRRKIINVFAKQNYNCFACPPFNSIGLQMHFWETDEGVESEWNPNNLYEGYPGVIHGGIQSTLLDEIAAWTVYIKAHTSGVTSRLNVRYKKPVLSDQHHITLKGKIREVEHSLCFIETQLLDQNGVICAEAEAVYFIYPPEKAIKMNWYPEDYSSFFEK